MKTLLAALATLTMMNLGCEAPKDYLGKGVKLCGIIVNGTRAIPGDACLFINFKYRNSKGRPKAYHTGEATMFDNQGYGCIDIYPILDLVSWHDLDTDSLKLEVELNEDRKYCDDIGCFNRIRAKSVTFDHKNRVILGIFDISAKRDMEKRKPVISYRKARSE